MKRMHTVAQIEEIARKEVDEEGFKLYRHSIKVNGDTINAINFYSPSSDTSKTKNDIASLINQGSGRVYKGKPIAGALYVIVGQRLYIYVTVVDTELNVSMTAEEITSVDSHTAEAL